MVENEGSRAIAFLLRVSIHPICLLVGTAVCLPLQPDLSPISSVGNLTYALGVFSVFSADFLFPASPTWTPLVQQACFPKTKPWEPRDFRPLLFSSLSFQEALRNDTLDHI